jgi:hypothetical protein
MNLNEINIFHSKVNSKNTFVFAALLGHESRTVSFGVSTGFRLSFSRSFNKCLILNRMAYMIFLSKLGKT